MANHKSTLKRIRQSSTRRLRNRYASKTSRTMIKQFRAMTDRQEAERALPKVYSTLDRLARKNIIHRNKAANLKSKMALHLKSL
ncbi:30S ribosomal protein S20 [uncultured Porphyromonas sp.]|uniref:30S ribosomal protein S20 n=1 Tax=uncultured Porphyromonas sp. TaxID=159274 RepID=UPI0028059A5D|nr:30S ribosomal protein S20 [uncultured Porphyromonas sp.]